MDPNKNPGSLNAVMDDGAHEADLATEPVWYEITLAGRRFNISSRYGEEHIRELERLTTQTFEEVGARLKGQQPLHVALLTALNLADQLVSERLGQRHERNADSRRINQLIEGLDTVLYSRDAG